ncbi:hypothetical protein [uncultured Phascolarctobacterium sp.]|uniref:hypothetical protein n=1 Tax=uncultured Phascolarctobacterium sp. TaxID=512296 RepID=UPI0025F4FA95|nr:hypothetical protein [uncultured Phascolarctobacterium sp.]
MYLFGIKKWYFNWVLMILTFAVFPPLTMYMLYRMIKDFFNESNKRAYYEQLAEEVREETRLEELRKTREAIKQNK